MCVCEKERKLPCVYVKELPCVCEGERERVALCVREKERERVSFVDTVWQRGSLCSNALRTTIRVLYFE